MRLVSYTRYRGHNTKKERFELEIVDCRFLDQELLLQARSYGMIVLLAQLTDRYRLSRELRIHLRRAKIEPIEREERMDGRAASPTSSSDSS